MFVTRTRQAYVRILTRSFVRWLVGSSFYKRKCKAAVQLTATRTMIPACQQGRLREILFNLIHLDMMIAGCTKLLKGLCHHNCHKLHDLNINQKFFRRLNISTYQLVNGDVIYEPENMILSSSIHTHSRTRSYICF